VPESVDVIRRSVYSNSGWLSVASETPITVMSVCGLPNEQAVPAGGHDPLDGDASVTVKVPPELQSPVLGVLDAQLATIFAGPFVLPILV